MAKTPAASAVFEALVSELEAATGLNVVKGFPTWARPDHVPPIGALRFQALGLVATRPRIGQKYSERRLEFRFWVFARNEPELLALTDDMAAWGEDAPIITIDGKPVEVVFNEADRNEEEAGVEQERYALFFPIGVKWSP